MSKLKLGLLISCCLTAGLIWGQGKPNVLLIITDDQGWGDVGFHQNKQIDTPNLDTLASNSVELSRFYVSPVCAPTRASLLTGKYHLSTGTTWVTHRMEVMRSEELTIAELLKDNGYETALFGKWHNGKQYPHDPTGQGFETFFGFSEGHLNNYFNTTLQYQYQKVNTEGYVPDLLTDSAIHFMANAREPFFCYLSYNTPHGPFQLPDELFEKYKARGFDNKTAAVYGMVENIDQNIGRLLKSLKKNGDSQHTIIIFMTDNGPNGERFNGGFKGIKAHVDEGGVRVPFLIRYDQAEWRKRKVYDMTGHIDLLPTLAELCSVKLPDSVDLDGISLNNLFSNGLPLPDRYFFTHQVIREMDTLPGAIRSDQYLLTLKEEELALYDIKNDSLQKTDISQGNDSLTSILKKEYYKWFSSATKFGTAPPPIEVGHTSVPIIEIPAPDASVISAIDFKGGMGWAHDYFINWTDQSKVSWDIKSVANSNYYVYVELSNPSDGKIRLILERDEDDIMSTLDQKVQAQEVESPDRHPRGGVFEKDWPKIKIGEMNFQKGQSRLSLSLQGKDLSSVEVKGLVLTKKLQNQ